MAVRESKSQSYISRWEKPNHHIVRLVKNYFPEHVLKVALSKDNGHSAHESELDLLALFTWA